MMSVYQVLVLFHDTVYAPGSAALLNDDVYITAMCVVQRDAGLFRRPGRWNSVRSPDFQSVSQVRETKNHTGT